MHKELINDTSRDLVFTSGETARKFGNQLARDGYDHEAEHLRAMVQRTGLSEQDGDTLHPPVRLNNGLDLQQALSRLAIR